jgi:hypothetical protein
VIANDPDGDVLVLTPRAVPLGARLALSDDASGVSLFWRPTEAEVGEHDLVFEITDGELTTRVKRRVRVLPKWASRGTVHWLVPGAGASAFLTHREPQVFVGGAFDATLAAVRTDGDDAVRCEEGTRHDECVASHHRFYSEFEVLGSTSPHSPALFTYGIGYSGSFELVALRRYLVPHYGLDLGGLVRSGLGHRAETRPYLGLHLWASNALWVNLTLGYRIVPANLADLSGPTAGLKLLLMPW